MKNRYHILSESPKVSDQELEKYMDFEALLENRKTVSKSGKSRTMRYWTIGISLFLIISIGVAGWLWLSNESAPLNSSAEDTEKTSHRMPTDHNADLGLGLQKEGLEHIKTESDETLEQAPSKHVKTTAQRPEIKKENSKSNAVVKNEIPSSTPSPDLKKTVPEPGEERNEVELASDETIVQTPSKKIKNTESGPRLEVEEIKLTKKESYETYVHPPSKSIKKKTKVAPLKESSQAQITSANKSEDAVREIQSTVREEEYNFIDAKPRGGKEALYQYLSENLVYPKGVKDTTIEGEVLVNFTITREGKVANVKVTQSLGTLFDEAAIQVIKGMPDWTPATLNGNHVESKLSIPLYFNLDNGSDKK